MIKVKFFFNRFYKESDRGLGIGLHIVSKLLNDLEYKYSFEVFGNDDVCFWILVTSNDMINYKPVVDV